VETVDNSELHSSLMLGATVRTAGSRRYFLVMSTLMAGAATAYQFREASGFRMIVAVSEQC
jgi:hypothetical protein